jgi:hypothetical protein
LMQRDDIWLGSILYIWARILEGTIYDTKWLAMTRLLKCEGVIMVMIITVMIVIEMGESK